jgi:hypothetical protein
VDDCFSIDFLLHWVHKYLLNNRLLIDFLDDVLSLFNVSLMCVDLRHNGKMFLFNKGSVFLMNDRLVVLVDVLLIDDGLVVLMDDVLMVLMHYVLLVLHQNILVMLMDDILMDFFDDGNINMGLMDFSFLSVDLLLAFIEGLDHSLLVVLNMNRSFINLLYDSFSSPDILASHILLILEVLSLQV